MQWVPAHCGLSGTERADGLARGSSALPQREIPVVKTIQSAVVFSVGSSWQQLSGWLVSSDVAGPTPGPGRGG